jgi:O-antigen/teichoic acid export membrane protein
LSADPSADPRPASRHDLRSIIRAFRVTFGASILSIVFGIGTNKITALVAGAEGIALIGLFRNLTNFISGTLSLGSTNVIVQRISTTASDEEARVVVRATARFFLLQTVVLIAIAIGVPRQLSSWLFGTTAHVSDVRVALLMVIGVLALQLVLEMLNGRALVEKVSKVNIFTSALTLITVYPLLRLGPIGLAMIIGFTCFFGAALGARYVWRVYGLSWSQFDSRSRAGIFRTIPVSFFVTLRTVACTGALLAVQSIVNRHYGTSALGLYNAASTIESTAIMLLMSAMRSYYLPILGQIADPVEKSAFVNRILRVLLLFLLPGGVALVFTARYVIWLLFSKTFVDAANFAAVLGMSMVAQAYLWCYGFFIIHKANYRLGMILDVAWAGIYVGGALLCLHFDLPLIAVPCVYLGSYCIYAVCYIVASRMLYHTGLITVGNALLGPGVLAIIGGAFFVARHGVVAEIGYGLAVVAVAVALLRTLLPSQLTRSA